MLGTGEPRIRPLAAEVRAWTDGLLREVRADRLRDDVQRLPAPRSRLHAPDAMAQAETMLLDEFGAAGWPAERQPFAFTRVLGCLDYGAYAPVVYPRLEGVNIIATKQGARRLPRSSCSPTTILFVIRRARTIIRPAWRRCWS